MATVVSYTTVDNVYLTLAEIGSMSTVNSAAVAHQISRAEALINARIAMRYSIPLSGTYPILETLATDIAIYNILTSRISINEESPWFVRYRDAKKTLKDLAIGDMMLLTSSGEVLTGRTDLAEVWSNTKDYNPTFWEGPIEEQVPDSDKIEDQGDDRDITITDLLR